MGQIRVVLIFNEDNERQKEIGEYLKSQKRCKTALITELVYAWLYKENKGVSSYNNVNVSVEDRSSARAYHQARQLLEDKEFMQQLKVGMNMEGESEKEQEEVKNDGMDMDEEMMMAGLSMFENDF